MKSMKNMMLLIFFLSLTVPTVYADNWNGEAAEQDSTYGGNDI